MRPALWAIAAALPLASPPKLLINAQLETRSAASGLDGSFRQWVAAQTLPAWIGYAVPLVRGSDVGCEYVSPDGRSAPGVVHLERPDHAVILFRVESGAVSRIRVLSPDCEIDAGGLPVRWLDDVRPAESTALLQSFATPKSSRPGTRDDGERLRESAVYALSVSEEPSALDALIVLARKDGNPRIRRRCIAALARSRDPRAVAFFEDVLNQ